MRGVTLAALACVIAIGPTASAREINKDYHESFDVVEGVRLELRHGDGDVTITPWEKDVIDVTVRYRADVKTVGVGSDSGFHVEFSQVGDVVRVVGKESSGSGIVVFRSRELHEYTYSISAPSYTNLTLDGDDGCVKIGGWRADIECSIDDGDVILGDIVNGRTTINYEDGDITIDDLEGELALRGDDGSILLTGSKVTAGKFALQDGDLVATDCEGDFTVDIDDGDVLLELIRSEGVRFRGQDGDLTVDLMNSESVDLDVMMDDGDVTITLPKDASVSFRVTVDDGDVDVDIANMDEFEQDRHGVSGKVRGGAGQVLVRVQDGTVLLRERE